MVIPDKLNTNDVIDAIQAGIEAIERDKAKVVLASYRLHVLRELKDSVQHQSRNPGAGI